MHSSNRITIPRYLKIAVALASRIASGDLQEGKKLKGRSVLSAEYGVSAETIRRAISILSDRGVVQPYAGSGVHITSKEKAIEFVRNFRNDESVSEMNAGLAELFRKRKALDEEIIDITKQIIDVYRYMNDNLITPIALDIPLDSPMIGKSIGKLEIWHNTGATVIGIVKNNEIIVSPGPYYEFQAEDKILFVGDNSVRERFLLFMTDKEKASDSFS